MDTFLLSKALERENLTITDFKQDLRSANLSSNEKDLFRSLKAIENRPQYAKITLSEDIKLAYFCYHLHTLSKGQIIATAKVEKSTLSEYIKAVKDFLLAIKTKDSRKITDDLVIESFMEMAKPSSFFTKLICGLRLAFDVMKIEQNQLNTGLLRSFQKGLERLNPPKRRREETFFVRHNEIKKFLQLEVSPELHKTRLWATITYWYSFRFDDLNNIKQIEANENELIITLNKDKTSKGKQRKKTRLCTCESDATTCPLEIMKAIKQDNLIPLQMSNSKANENLRKLLMKLGIDTATASKWSWHDLRRGLIEDLEGQAVDVEFRRMAGTWTSKTADKRYHSDIGLGKIIKDATKTF